MAKLLRSPLARRSSRRPHAVRRDHRGAPTRRATPATVLVRPEVFRTIAAASAGAGRCETGGPLLGTVQRSWESGAPRLLASVLGTVPPGPQLDGTPGSVAMGLGGDGERAASALRWWRSTTGLELLHLGDWHRHPSGSPQPSHGDRVTARRMREQSAAPIWLAAIAVSEQVSRADADVDGSVARFSRAWAGAGAVRFYRESEEVGLARISIRIEGHAIPGLPPLPWHIADPARFAAECRLLHAEGLTLGIGATPSDAPPGLAVSVNGDGAPPLTLLTGPRYPHEMPVALDDRGRRVLPRGPWTPDRFLVDLVREVR